ncbi:hypothetical protein ACN3XK_35240 [Actinomadura welshii]
MVHRAVRPTLPARGAGAPGPPARGRRRRGAAGRRPGDPEVAGLVDRLRAESADFRRRWAEHEVAVRRADRKTFVHPRVGDVLMDCETLVTPDQRQQLLVLTPADDEARERLDLLRVLGTQEFAGGAADMPDR